MWSEVNYSVVFYYTERREKEAKKEKMERLKSKRGHSPEDHSRDSYREDWEVASTASSTPGQRSHLQTPEVSPRHADDRGKA